MTDKICIQQIFGSLMHRPQILGEVDKYSITYADFRNRFERLIFGAISGLYQNGANRITPFDIDNYLSYNDGAKKFFDGQNGLEFLQDVDEFANLDSFPYYYQKFKKINALDDLKRDGFPVADFYIEDLTNPKAAEVNSAFEELSTRDIFSRLKNKLLSIEKTYNETEEVKEWDISEDIDDIIDNLGKATEIGLPIQGEILNRVIDGAQKSCLTIRSGASGTGKTRNAVADACMLAFPMRYNSITCKWEQVGSNEKVLFIITEQTDRQIKKMILAYLTDINESRFKMGNFSDREKQIILQAKEVIKEFSKNFVLVRIPNPTIELVKTVVRERCLINNIGYVFYDYIFIGPALLNEFKGCNVRNDEVLLMLATALKDLAVELQVCVFTSTQVNSKADDNKEIRNEASLAGGRSTINKADNGMIMARPTNEELEVLESVTEAYGRPNLVTDIFKVRSGQWTQVRIWSIVNLGTMRRKDLFITDSRLEVVKDFFAEPYAIVQEWEDEEFNEIKRKVDSLNEL